LLTICGLVCLSALVQVGELRLEPDRIAPGEVALVRWIDTAPISGEVTFNGSPIALDATDQGGVALVGTDLETAPGEYPVRLRLAGGSEMIEGCLRVVAARRPEERLTLPKAMVSPQDPAVLKRIERDQKLLRRIFAVRSPGTLPKSFVLPVADPMGSPFGLRRILNGEPRSPHAGVDFRSPRGTPVKASAAGRVAFTGDLYYTGLTVVIDHGHGLFSLYCHLRSIDCAATQVVAGGATLGRVGSTGRSTGPHLHWGVKLRGDRVDPLALAALLRGKKS
jgi:murein DD-endopeptidase MepM/ murein hydrolase activator NlpD